MIGDKLKPIELKFNPYTNGMRIDYYSYTLIRILQFLSSSMAFLRWICVFASWIMDSMGYVSIGFELSNIMDFFFCITYTLSDMSIKLDLVLFKVQTLIRNVA